MVTASDSCMNNVCVCVIYQNAKLGDSWNYMPPILVSSSANRIATQSLVTTILNRRKDFILWGSVYDIKDPSNKLPIQS